MLLRQFQMAIVIAFPVSIVLALAAAYLAGCLGAT